MRRRRCKSYFTELQKISDRKRNLKKQILSDDLTKEKTEVSTFSLIWIRNLSLNGK
jgi:hypothetical protein